MPSAGVAGSPRVLLEGRPGVGKTTAARRTAELLRAAGIPVAGFVTEEIREGGQRVGFAVESLAGERGLLAHLDFPGPPRVGKYGVDLAAFERVALPSLAAPPTGAILVIDELGKMELASSRFRDSVLALFGRTGPLLATVHAHRDPFTDALKRRSGVETWRVEVRNRELLPERLARRLRGE